MRKRLFVICIALSVLSIGYLTSATSNPFKLAPAGTKSAKAASILKFDIPVVTHGFITTSGLPNGDLFLLPTPMTMSVSAPPEGAQVFPVNIENFGGDAESIGALSGVSPAGLSLSTPNNKVTALTCSDNFWDGNLLLASTGNTDGDKIRLFLQYSDGKPGPEIGLFTVRGMGVDVTDLHPHMMIWVNNRLANGPSIGKGAYIPFSVSAGANGFRTDLLTLGWPMGFFSPLQGCFQIGVEITRGSTQGTTSIVVTDLVVNRNRVAGDENNAGFGLLARLTGGYPTGLPCKVECPSGEKIPEPPTPNPPTPADADDCNAICYRSPQYFRLNLNRLPLGTVLIGGVNFNRPVSTTDKRAMNLALRGGWTPLQQLNAEFVAAQLNMLNAGGDGSPKAFYAGHGKLKCYGLDFEPITLSDGFVLSPETKIKDLYQQCRLCINLNLTQDFPALTRVFDMLNGNNPLNTCNNAW
jgi:hypothetical protein